ncbi:MAG: ABC transporter ATP-binding protein [Desulfuromonadales bacterium]
MLRIENLESGYDNLKIIQNVSIRVNPGEIVSIIGANGAGKTTLLKTITGLLRPLSGEIHFGGQEITRTSTEKIVFLGCSLVPEGRQVFAPMTVRENLTLGGYVQYRRNRGSDVLEDLERIYKLFPRLLERETQFAGSLSGGEQQMLAIGRAMMARPKLVMMDEPSMGLAPLVIKEIFSIVRMLRDEGATILLVEQNAKAALRLADRGYVLETGKIILEGPAAELLENEEVKCAYLGKVKKETKANPP